MSIFNAIMNSLFDVILFPFKGMAPVVGLTVFSILAGILLLLLYKYTSPQKRIKAVKARIKAGLLAIRIFKDDLGVLSGAIGRLFLKDIPHYLGCNCLPLVPLIIIVVPMLVQLDSRYGFAPFEAGDRFVLEVTLSKEAFSATDGSAAGADPKTAILGDVVLELPEGLIVESGPVRIPEKGEVAYRIRIDREGDYDMKIHALGEEYTKSLAAAADLPPAISSARFSVTETLDLLENPVESAWPSDSAIQSVKIRDHSRRAMLGIDGDYFPWGIIFCLVGLAFGFALKGVFKVNI